MADPRRQRQYLVFFIEDLIEHFLSKQGVQWHTTRSPFLQTSYNEIPAAYKFSEEVACAAEIGLKTFDDLCVTQMDEVLEKVMGKEEPERPQCLNKSIEDMSVYFFRTTPTNFILFLSTIGLLSVKIYRSFGDSLFLTVVNAAVSCITRLGLGDDEVLFDTIKSYATTVIEKNDVAERRSRQRRMKT